MLPTWRCILSALPCVRNAMGTPWLVSSRSGGAWRCSRQEVFLTPREDKPSSATQPFKHAAWPAVKHFPFPPRGCCNPPLPGALAAVPRLFWSFSSGLGNNQRARGRHQHQTRGYRTSLPSLALCPSLSQSHEQFLQCPCNSCSPLSSAGIGS